MTVAEMERKIHQIDRSHTRQYELLSSFHWGEKQAYHLCINTSGRKIKALSPTVAAYCKIARKDKETHASNS